MPERRTKIALIAHDGRKADMVAFATFNRNRLAEFDLVATATTSDLVTEKVGLACDVRSPNGDSIVRGPVAQSDSC